MSIMGEKRVVVSDVFGNASTMGQEREQSPDNDRFTEDSSSRRELRLVSTDEETSSPSREILTREGRNFIAVLEV